MAKIVHAVRQYGPRVEQQGQADIDALADWIARNTGLTRGELVGVLAVLHEAILDFNRRGTSVKLPDIGVFSPGIDREGNLRVNFRADTRLKRLVNRPDSFYGVIRYKGRIGWTDAQYKALWDTEHPDDPLDV
ncbi:MAG: hypothetical protein KC443_13910 [Anaerolineales bacterium]|nr:hypothetical protein [Anaerolineales bacterium]